MNKIREKIKDELFNASDNDINIIMEIVEAWLEAAFEGGREQDHVGCGEWEDTYSNWKEWYDEEVNIK
jgi:ribose 5-phosphate isomerase RpiB